MASARGSVEASPAVAPNHESTIAPAPGSAVMLAPGLADQPAAVAPAPGSADADASAHGSRIAPAPGRAVMLVPGLAEQLQAKAPAPGSANAHAAGHGSNSRDTVYASQSVKDLKKLACDTPQMVRQKKMPNGKWKDMHRDELVSAFKVRDASDRQRAGSDELPSEFCNAYIVRHPHLKAFKHKPLGDRRKAIAADGQEPVPGSSASSAAVMAVSSDPTPREKRMPAVQDLSFYATAGWTGGQPPRPLEPGELGQLVELCGDYAGMGSEALRELADKTPGMSKMKKDGQQWVKKSKRELVEEFAVRYAQEAARAARGAWCSAQREQRGEMWNPAAGGTTLIMRKGNAAAAIADHDTALKHYGKVLEVKLESVGAQHPFVASLYVDIALANAHMGRHELALEYQGKALDITVQHLGAWHPDVGQCHDDMFRSAWALGRHDLAQLHMEAARRIFQRHLGVDHYVYQKFVPDWQCFVENAERSKRELERQRELERAEGSKRRKSLTAPCEEVPIPDSTI